MANTLDNNKVVLGLSGGVDSTAAALTLKAKGYEVIGLYFDISKNNENGIAQVKKVASEIGINVIIKNVHNEFEGAVINNFIDEYKVGRTPNPCVICNPLVKFKTLIDVADANGAKFIATGHYAKVEYSEIQKCYVLKKPLNEKKDQSYMLHRLPESYLERFLLPLAEIEDKEFTREIARKNNMSNSEAKDSQEICFIPHTKTYIDFLNDRNIQSKGGNFVDTKGNILGKHNGVSNYTIGQRKGLGIALGKPAFVINIDPNTGDIILGENEDLFSNTVVCENVHFTSTGTSEIPAFLLGNEVKCKIRYASNPSEATLRQNGDRVEIIFEKKQRAITPGQSVVIYYMDEVCGGGIII